MERKHINIGLASYVAVLLAAMFIIKGCTVEVNTSNEKKGPAGKIEAEVVCLDGVQYYYGWGTHRTYLAPKIYPDGAPATCDDQNEQIVIH